MNLFPSRKRVSESEEDYDPREKQNESLWLIIYTDMISNLMIFFLMLYCLTWLTDLEKQVAAASFQEAFSGKRGEIRAALDEMEKGLDKNREIEGKVREEFSDVEVNEQQITIVLPSPVLFDSGSATLKEATKSTLHQIAEIMRSIPNTVIVEGHTDDIPMTGGAFASNWELSSARAFSVVRYLIEKERIDPRRLAALGFGEYQPKIPNVTPENRAKNRRIEIIIIKAT